VAANATSPSSALNSRIDVGDLVEYCVRTNDRQVVIDAFAFAQVLFEKTDQRSPATQVRSDNE
jgi:hypothetical protein